MKMKETYIREAKGVKRFRKEDDGKKAKIQKVCTSVLCIDSIDTISEGTLRLHFDAKF